MNRGTILTMVFCSLCCKGILEIICLSSLVGGGLLLLSIFTVTSALKKPK